VALFRNRYRTDSVRLAKHDYTTQGEYFVTICTDWKVCHFGNIVGGEMCLSTIGSIVQEEWKQTACVRANVELDAFVVMPNHVHGIIVIKKSFVETIAPIVSCPSETTHQKIETTHRVVSTKDKTNTLIPNSLGSIVG
jgi:putative transposase